MSAVEVRFTQRFLDAVHDADVYFQLHSPLRGKRFVKELFSLLYDVVAAFPQAQPLFRPLCEQLPGREFRKAIFRRQYLAIYEVLADRLVFVLFRHTSLDPDSGFEEVVAELR